MRLFKIYVVSIVFLFVTLQCSSSTEPEKKTPPEGHIINKKDFMHKPGLADPLTNCVACHGSALKGGDVGVSCYSCHTEKW